MSDNEKNMFVKCTCGAEVLELSHWLAGKGEYPILEATVYTHAGYHTRFFTRIREAWAVFRFGRTGIGVTAVIGEGDRLRMIEFLQSVEGER